MNARMLIAAAAVAACGGSGLLLAQGQELRYRLEPGQIWRATISSQTESSFGGTENVQRQTTIVEYRVTEGERPGWIVLEARILKQSDPEGGGGLPFDISTIRYRADMHTSGEVRGIDVIIDAADAAVGKEQPPEAQAALEQMTRMFAESWKVAAFWFPELPEEALEPGDEFDVRRSTGSGDMGPGVQMKLVSRQSFTLDDLSEGLAYFTVVERSEITTSVVGGESSTQGQSKGAAIFDLGQGMWLEFEARSVYRAELPAGMMGGEATVRVLHRVRMERQD